MLGDRFLVFGALILALGALAPVASAQDEDVPTAALLRSTTDDEGLRGALDRIARSSLDELAVAAVSGTLALDLEQAQLALGCMAVSAECLGTVATENEVQLLIAPRLDDTGDERVLTVVLYDERSGTVTQATRRIASSEGNDAVLDAVPGLLRELFGLPLDVEEEPELDATEANLEEGEAEAEDAPPPDDGVGLGGPILLGAGGAALIGGVIAGVLFKSADDDWSAATVGDAAAAMDAADLRSQAETRGRAATTLFIAGGALAVGGLVWLLVDLMGGDDDGVALTPHFGVGGGRVSAGLSMELSL